MDIVWFMEEKDYDKYQREQFKYPDTEEGEHVGCVRTGNLCYDIISYRNHLWFDLYVGMVDSGYSYSLREGYEGYPFDYADSCSFKWSEDLRNLSFDEFKKDLTEYIEEHINALGGYVIYGNLGTVDLISKANEALKLW